MNRERRDLLRRCRRLSSLRVAEHGPLPDDGQVWWAQLERVAEKHGIEMPSPEQWRNANNDILWDHPL